MSMDIDVDAVNMHPEQILTLSLEQYNEISKLYDDRELKKSGINHDLLKAALNALNCHTINTYAEKMCNLKVIGRGDCTIYTSGGECFANGGYGRVVKLSLPTPLAAKFLKIVNKGEARACLRWVRESRIWKEMDHPNIVPLLGIWMDFPQLSYIPAFVMPLMDGDLSSYLQREEGRTTPIRRRMQYLLEVLRALSYMHNHRLKVSHGDLRAVNILLKDNHALLCDFGLSRAGDGLKSFLTSSQTNCRWLAPERYLEKMYAPTPETDMYEYGLTFCEVVTGKIPWHDLIDNQVMIARFYNPKTPLPRPPSMPDAVWDFVQLCIRETALDRVDSVQALAMVQVFVDSRIDWPLAL